MARLTEDTKRRTAGRYRASPSQFRAAVKGLSDQQLDTPYRPEGWTVRQVTHHVPDSHLNAYIRFKLALTEDEPTIKPYAEDRWAQLADTQATPVEVSLTLLDSLHERWMQPAALAQTGRLEAHVPSSRTRPDAPGEKSGALRLARTPSRRPHHHVARA